MKRKAVRIAAWALCAALLAGSLPAPVSAGTGSSSPVEFAALYSAGETGGGVTLNSHITALNIDRESGGQWTMVTDNILKNGDHIRINMSYMLPANTLPSDRVVTYQLPDGIKVQTSQQGLIYKGSEAMGEYTVTTAGLLTITYYDSIDASLTAVGTLSVEGYASNTGSGDVTVHFADAVADVTIKPGEVVVDDTPDLAVAKSSGKVSGNQGIAYTLKVSSVNGTGGQTVTITDAMDNSAAYPAASAFVLKRYYKNASGTLVSEILTTLPTITNTNTAGDNASGQSTFTYANLPALGKGERYEVTYTAAVTDQFRQTLARYQGTLKINNRLSGTFGGKTVSTSSSQGYSHTVLVKTGAYDKASGVITWSIKVNKDNAVPYVVTDPAVQNAADPAVYSDFAMTPAAANAFTGFPYTFAAGDIGTYTLTFKQKNVWPAFGSSLTVRNEAKISLDGGTPIASGYNVGVGQVDLMTKVWHAEQAAQAGRLYIWQTTLLVPAGGLSAGAKYTDALGDYLTTNASLLNLSVIAAKTDGATAALDTGLYALAVAADGKSFTVTFPAGVPKTTADSLTLTYTTLTDASDLADNATRTYRNTAKLTMNGKTETDTAEHKYTAGKPLSKLGGAHTSPVYNPGAVSYVNGDFSTEYSVAGGYLYYRVLINVDKSMQGEFTVSDTFPAGTQLIFNDQKSYIGFAFYVDGQLSSTATNQNGVSVSAYQLIEDYNYVGYDEANLTAAGYWFKVGTGYEGLAIAIDYVLKIVDDRWDNPAMETATYINHVVLGGYSAAQSQTVHRKIDKVSKSGAQQTDNPNIVSYNVIVNPASAKLTDNGVITLTDQLDHAALDPYVTALYLENNSLKVYRYDSTKADKKGEALDSSLYTQRYDQTTQTLTVTMPDATALVLSYSYYFKPKTRSGVYTLTNHAQLSGVENGDDQSSTSLDFTKSSATVDQGAITVYKVKKGDYAAKLAGAVFVLSRFDGTAWANTGTTYTSPASGMIVIDLYAAGGNFTQNTLYRLEETRAPAGYAKAGKPIYFAFGAAGASLDEIRQGLSSALTAAKLTADDVLIVGSAGVTTYFENEPDTLTVKKVWSGGTPETSATVKVYRQSQTLEYDTLTVTWTYLENSVVRTKETTSYQVKPGTKAAVTVRNYYGTVYLYGDGGTLLAQNTGNYATNGGNPSVAVTMNGDTSVTVQTDYAYALSEADVSYVKPTNYQPIADRTYLKDASGSESVVLNAGNNWSYTWDPVDLYDPSGVPYIYVAEEADIPANWGVSYFPGSVSSGTITVTNTRISKSLTLNKRNTAGAALPGAVFTLYAASGDAWTKGAQVAAQTTDGYGQVTFAGLGAGNYLLYETTPPAGYYGPAAPWRVTVTRDAVSVAGSDVLTAKQLSGDTITNYPTVPELPATGGMGPRQIVCLGLGLMLLAGLLATSPRRRKA